jgi:hypothetical protein
MESIDANGNLIAEKLIDEEFVSGIKTQKIGTQRRTPVEIQMLETIKQKLRENYKWNDKTNFDFLAAQKCSDMIVEVGKCIFRLKYFIYVKKMPFKRGVEYKVGPTLKFVFNVCTLSLKFIYVLGLLYCLKLPCTLENTDKI